MLHFSPAQPRMIRKLVFAGLVLFAAAALVVFLPLFYRHQSPACKQRGANFETRVERLKQDARKSLAIGNKKDAVIRFFAENGLPAGFLKGEVTGTVTVSGCAPAGCGSDLALFGMRVAVDNQGTVIAAPVVGAVYTDCL
ncbi:MAG TPA: hypothetical protein VNV86_10280 [Candidatus Acidoferrum sp.]|nr:hypothetical protein [Candidatus Acidoferrum sp.]